MEFPKLGKRCGMEGCSQLDFLPFVCDLCTIIHCLEHRTYTSHKCPLAESRNVVMPVCPLCDQMVFVERGGDADRKMDEHISSGCPRQDTTVQRSNPCSATRCRGGELVPVICPHCRKNFCLAHRASADHDCTYQLQASPARGPSRESQEKQNRVLSYIQSLTQSRSNTPTGAKVRLIRMKQKSQGSASVPAEKRYYVEAIFPMDSGVKPKLMFFNADWTVGKVLDVIADAGNVENLNNVHGAEKLYLISLATGEPLSTSAKLRDIDPSILSSGGALLLEKMTNVERDK